MFPWALQPLSECDPEVLSLIEKEKNRQWRGLELIASEVPPEPPPPLSPSLVPHKTQRPLVAVGWARAWGPPYPPAHLFAAYAWCAGELWPEVSASGSASLAPNEIPCR